VKVKRRTTAPEPGDRLRALARLKAATPGAVRHEELGSDEEVRGGWIPEAVLPERLRGSRWALAPRHIAVVAFILVLGLAWAGWSLFHSRPEVIPDMSPPAVGGSPVSQPSSGGPPAGQPTPGLSPGLPSSTGATSPSAQEVVVDVAGKVRRPGLVRTTPGARVADVLALAGGALPGVDLTTLNLARQVTDGEQILVGVPGAPPPTTPGAAASPTLGSQTPLDLNKATLADLESLPGVGPVLAQRILDWRTEHGRFTTVDELQEVSGVGQKKFDSLKPHVRV
jgi:competence protein ComEA